MTNKERFATLHDAVKSDLGAFTSYELAGAQAMAMVKAGAAYVGKRFTFESPSGVGVVVAGDYGWAVLMESNFFMSDAYSHSGLAYYRHEGVAMDQTFFDLAIAGFPLVAVTELFDRAAADIKTPEALLIQWLVAVKQGLSAMGKSVPLVPTYDLFGPEGKVLQIERFPTLRRRARAAAEVPSGVEDYLLDEFVVHVPGNTPVVLTEFLANDHIAKYGYDADAAGLVTLVREDILRRCAL